MTFLSRRLSRDVGRSTGGKPSHLSGHFNAFLRVWSNFLKPTFLSLSYCMLCSLCSLWFLASCSEQPPLCSGVTTLLQPLFLPLPATFKRFISMSALQWCYQPLVFNNLFANDVLNALKSIKSKPHKLIIASPIRNKRLKAQVPTEIIQ